MKKQSVLTGDATLKRLQDPAFANALLRELSDVIAENEALRKLEALAWRLVCHDHAATVREDTYQCVELQHLIDYFETHGVPCPDLEEARPPASKFGVVAKA